MAAANLTPARVRELLNYSHETGLFTWRVKRQTGARPGDPAGCIDKCLGYVRIYIDGVTSYGHILAWLYMTDLEPPRCIDHINGDRADNRWGNLRAVSLSFNSKNRNVGKSKVKVHARSVANGKVVNAGYHPSRQAAKQALKKLKEAESAVTEVCQQPASPHQASLFETCRGLSCK